MMLKIKECYPISGDSVVNRRRDMRDIFGEPGQKGRIFIGQSGELHIVVEQGDPHALTQCTIFWLVDYG